MLFGCMALVVALFSSCLKDSESTVTYSGDAAITAFSLGNLKKYTKVKAKNGSDSTAVATVSGSGYKFYIDQVERTIYNPDSLPYGIDAKHVLCTISSKNSGIITIKSMISDSLFYYRSEDSIDFSVPRTIQVNSLDGKNRARYTVKVNVHKEPADSFLWDNVGAVGVFQNAVEMKAVALNEKVFVFANDGISTFVFSTPENGIGWNLENEYQPLPANACRNVVTLGEYMFVLADGYILRSEDGHQWTRIGRASIAQLLAAGSRSLYARDFDGGLLSSDDHGKTWEQEGLDDSPMLLPTNEISCCLVESRVNSEVETVSIIGNRSVSEWDEDEYAHVWSKVEDPSDEKHIDYWMYVSDPDYPTWRLPRLASLSVVACGNGLLALGGQGLGRCTEKGFQYFYFSNNGGIYWSKSTIYKLPKRFESSDVFTMTGDSSNHLWLICGGTGQVWRGRMSGGSPDIPTSYNR